MQSFIIVGYVWQILGRVYFYLTPLRPPSPPHLFSWAASKKSILNRVNIRTIKSRHQCSKKVIMVKKKVDLIFRHIQCWYLINSEVAWVLVSLGTQVHTEMIIDPDYLPEYFFASYAYALNLYLIPILKLEIWLESPLTTYWFLHKDSLLKAKFYFGLLFNTGIVLPSFKIVWLK